MSFSASFRPVLFLAPALALALPVSARAAEPFGYTQPYRQVKMAFPQTGVIAELPAKEGQAVKAGDVLARLDYQVLAKDLEITREELALQDDRVKKLQALDKDGRVSPEELKRALADQAEDNLKVQRTQAEIDERTLRSPVDGVVAEVKKEISESVDPAAHVLTVVQLDKLLVNIYLPPDRAAKFHPGADCTLYWSDGSAVNAANGAIPAQVEFVSPVTDAASNTVRVKFAIPNPNGAFASGVRCQTAPSSSVPGKSAEPLYQ